MTEPELVTVRETVDGTWIEASALGSMESVLRATIATFAQQRAAWRDGYSLWMGWGPLDLAAEGDGYVVTSPDYTRNPETDTTRDLSSAMWVLMGQALLTQEARVEPVEVQYGDDVIVTREWQDSRMLALSRVDPDGDDSGWFIQPFPPRTEGGWDASELERIRLWEAVQLREAVGRVLALPPGITGIIDGESVRTVVRDSDQTVLAANL